MSETLAIRAAEPADAAAIADIYAHYVRHTPISFEVVAPTPAEMTDRVCRVTAEYPWLVCTDGARVLGYAYLGRHHERAAYRWAVDVSVYVQRDVRRRGLGRALYTALLRLASAQGFCNAYAGITLPNPASVGLHESMGFTPLGTYRRVGYKLGTWHDVGYWELHLGERPDHPSPPRSLAELRGSAAWDAALAAGERLLPR
jgi:L-amino acid N-acyltransferase YncA